MSTTAEATPERPRYYKIAEAARDLCPVPIHPASLTRHILQGVRLRDGSTRKLLAIRTPGGWLVTREAVNEFLEAITADRQGGPAPVRTPGNRVEMALNAAGF